jgi:DNA-3-methyladenine glycosylase I
MKVEDHNRCWWANGSELMKKYHDQEWGNVVEDDKIIFEFLILESAQAGLSWSTVLNKREGYKDAFCGFDAKKVAAMTDIDVERLCAHPGIFRNRLKIKAAISNAQIFLGIQQEFGSFKNYMWQFLPNGKPIVNHFKDKSDAISKDLKKRGFKFFGTTICYAHMQATGMVNDHLTTCFKRK